MDKNKHTSDGSNLVLCINLAKKEPLGQMVWSLTSHSCEWVPLAGFPIRLAAMSLLVALFS